MLKTGLKPFLLGLFASILILVSFFTGAIADRMFVIKPLDSFFNKKPSGSPLSSLLNNNQGISQDFLVADISEEVSPSVVTVSVKQQQRVLEPSSGGILDFFGRSLKTTKIEEIQRDIGTGFVIESGLVVTNKHVVLKPGIEYSVIDKNDKEYKVKQIYRDPSIDLAILEIEGSKLPSLSLGDSDDLRVGEPVVAIGTALGEFRHTVTTGVISGLGRGIVAGNGATMLESMEGIIQTDAAINPGNSGGPLINSNSEVIGVNVATTTADNISFSIPINVIKISLANFEETGRFDRPFLGLQYKTIGDQAALFNKVPQGIYIAAVITNSSADKAGLKIGDIITKFDGKTLKSNDFAVLINKKKIGDKVNIEYWRDKKTFELELVLSGY